MNKKLFSVLYLGIFIGIVGLFFYPTVLRGNLPVPSDALIGLYHPWRDLYAKEYPRGIPFKNFLITDPVRQQIPWRKIAIDQWKEGKIPRWNPYTVSGAPLAANIQAAVFYPFNIVFFLFDFPMAWTILIILEPLLAGILLFLYLRHLGLTPLACLLGALAWSFSGFSIAWLTWGTMVHVALWLPLMLLSIDRLLQERKKNVWFVVFVLSMILQVFAGHAQIALYGIGIGLVYGVWRFLLDRRAAITMLPWFVSGLLVFLAVSSVQWIPFLRFVVESGRIGEANSWLKEGWFIPWQHLVQFLAPDFFGNPATLNYWGVWNYGEFIGYIGTIPLLFVLLNGFGKKNKEAIFWICVVAVALVFTLPTPLAKLPYQLRLPALSSLQPTRLMVVIDFALVILAATGFDGWLRKKDGRPWIPMLVGAIFFTVLWIIVLLNGGGNFQVSKRNLIVPTGLFLIGSLTMVLPSVIKKGKGTYLFGAILVGITVFDLLRFGWKFTPFTPREYFFPKTAVIEFLQKQEKPFRVMSTDKRILPPNVSAYFDIETIEGYDPLISNRYEELMASIARGKPDITPPFGFNRIVSIEKTDTRLLQLLGVRYILSLAELAGPDTRQVFAEGNTRVYEITDSAPRIYLVERYIERKEKQQVVEVLFDSLFLPGKHAVVEERIPVLNSSPLSISDSADLISYSPSLIELAVQVKDIPRLLVIANAYNPDWGVYIDGKQQKLLRVNYVFQGVVVPPGTHRVEFSL